MEADRVKGQTDSPVGSRGEWTWTVLGAGTILPRTGYGSAGHALRRADGGPVTLFDCGPGTIRALGPTNLAIGDVERVVVSHFHPDHWLDLLALAFARRNPTLGDLPALEIVGPRGLAEILERGASLVGSKSWLRFERTTVVEIDPAGGREPPDRGPIRLTWVATGHTPEGVAWRADLEGGASVAYTGDTGENPSVADLARGASLFVCECSFPDDRGMELHLTPSSAGRLAARAECRRLLLTHFYPAVDPETARKEAAKVYRGPIEVSRDGSVFPI